MQKYPDPLKKISKYFIFQFIPLFVDLGLFSLIEFFSQNLSILYINIISSTISFIVSYNINSKYIFKVKRKISRFLIYITYCFISIYFFSNILSYLYINKFPFSMPKIYLKSLLLPFSFLVNYLFKNIILEFKIRTK